MNYRKMCAPWGIGWVFMEIDLFLQIRRHFIVNVWGNNADCAPFLPFCESTRLLLLVAKASVTICTEHSLAWFNGRVCMFVCAEVEAERAVRRESYLKATWSERMDSSDVSDNDATKPTESPAGRWEKATYSSFVMCVCV
jgi:hypothetical protein